jgi:Xaa-Pro aminopeptidase
MSRKRIDALRKRAKKENLDGLVITHLDHVRYLTGFSGSSGLLAITPSGAHFYTDFRYKDQAGKQVTGAKVHIIEGDPVVSLGEHKELSAKNRRMGFYGGSLTVARLNQIKAGLKECLLVPADELFVDLGWSKDREEIANITKAVDIADTALERVLGLIQPGVRERELQAELEYQMLMLGSERPAFESIIASGWRSALPHGVASDKKIKKGEFITFDFGATYNGYVSDMTRTVVLGKATSRQKKIYNIVLRSQKAGVARIKAGVAAKKIDETCRKIITRAGYGKNFGHGTGHGIGIFIHEGPRLSGKSDDILRVNNVVTVEPGIYISGWGGVRIEDDVVVTRSGGRILNKTPKKLLEL